MHLVRWVAQAEAGVRVFKTSLVSLLMKGTKLLSPGSGMHGTCSVAAIQG